jgi:hypothetical protein
MERSVLRFGFIREKYFLLLKAMLLQEQKEENNLC